jgi:hypothetical protein
MLAPEGTKALEYLTDSPGTLESLRQTLVVIFGACALGLAMEAVEAVRRARKPAPAPPPGAGRRP